MSAESWRDDDIKALKSEKDRLDKRAIGNIWRSALAVISPSRRQGLEKWMREEGFDIRPTDESITRIGVGRTPADDLLAFKKALVRGACESLWAANGKSITPLEILKILQTSAPPEFQNALRKGSLRHWLKSPDFSEIVEHYGIISRPREESTRLYEEAIRQWWRENDSPPASYNIADILKKADFAVRSKIKRSPRLQELMKNRPEER